MHPGTRTTQKLPSAGSGPHPRTSAVSSSPPSDRPCPSRPQRRAGSPNTCGAAAPRFPWKRLCTCLSHWSGHGLAVLLLKHSWGPAFRGHSGHWVPGAIRGGVSHALTCKANSSANGNRSHLTQFIRPDFRPPLPRPTLREREKFHLNSCDIGVTGRACTSLCVFVFLCAFLCLSLYVSAYMCVQYVRVHPCMCSCEPERVSVHTYMCISVYLSVSRVCMCLHMPVRCGCSCLSRLCVSVSVHVCAYVHMHARLCRHAQGSRRNKCKFILGDNVSV